MKAEQNGKINMSVLVLLIGGMMLAALLLHGFNQGHELPLWPALLVAGVNIVAAGKIIMNIKKKKASQ